jgi:hypothetical protein
LNRVRKLAGDKLGVGALISSNRSLNCAFATLHPDSDISASGYYYPIGANRDFVGLASEPALLAAVNKALSELQAEGKIADFGTQAGLTYLPCRELAVLGNIWEKIFQK